MADPQPVTGAKVVAAIDIGANAIRMELAEVVPDGPVRTLERLQRAVRLGQDTFRQGHIAPSTIRAAAQILKDYRRKLDVYQVQRVRAVATSTVREATNADTFLDRVYMATGLEVEVIDTSEESRLTYAAVRQSLGGMKGVGRGQALLADVGGGSVLLTVLVDGELTASQSLRLGSIRLQEVLAFSRESPDRSTELLRTHIASAVALARNELGLRRVRTFIAVGGDARFVALHAGKAIDPAGLWRVSVASFDRLVLQCIRRTVEDLARGYGLAFADAETLQPALLVYQALLKATRARRLIVSNVSMRDGLLLDIAHRVTGREDETLERAVVRSAFGVAEKYRVEVAHARHVADLAVWLFDHLQEEHGLSRRHRLLLEVAALVHEVGGFVSNRAHHKHSYYLISNAEVFGLGRDELQIVALVARYHRRAVPKPTHLEYVNLPRDRRTVVSKLAALLRVADALDRGHAQSVRDLACELRTEEFVIRVPGTADLNLERRAVETKADLFEDVYGLHVRLERATGGTDDARRTASGA